ncbi:heterokaryon incompatibility 6 OR allele [Fusarium napiforme]|uniref:Heterokaryon incompatibility 6 OR allele n=1 Tax=Fusarium napiforme TaxID=42672 RepID=A0A8H5NG01_9HYPO|nr:heterokaryon incompatibility 6 OR allele [Fusarium napiforme]
MAEATLAIDYDQIDSATQIRLLNFQPGTGDVELVCTLSSVDREGAKYHALSYEWGKASKDDPVITVNDRKVQIRRNLYDALRSIRNSMGNQRLWIDAICINQSNVEEKSTQVAIMGNTFARATNVISWLGPANDDSDLAMDWMSDPESLLVSLPSFSKDSCEGKALFALCHRTYWRRIWIIQELHLAQSYVVWCGAKSIPNHNFEDSLAHLNVPESPFGGDKISEKNPANQHTVARLFRSDPALNNLRRWLWVSIESGFECSQKQDLIYALLGVSSDYEIMKWTFKVDYSKSAREVFVQLLWQRNISTWENPKEDETRWLDLAKKMNLSIDQDLEREISSRLSRHEDKTFKFLIDPPWQSAETGSQHRDGEDGLDGVD